MTHSTDDEGCGPGRTSASLSGAAEGMRGSAGPFIAALERTPQPMVMTASAGGVGPEVGFAIIRVTTTDFTADSAIASVEVDV